MEDESPDNEEAIEKEMDFLQVKEIVGEREIIRMKFPGSSGVDIRILPPTPRHSPPHPDGAQVPKIKHKPLDLDIPLGKDAVFELVVTDIADDVSVSWLKNNNILFNVGRYKIWSRGNSFFLQITQVQEQDESLYYYVVRNNFGEKTGDVELLVTEEDSSEYDDDEEDDNELEEESVKTKSKPGKEVKKVEPCFVQHLRHDYVITEGCPLELVVQTKEQPCEVCWFYEGRKLKTTGSEFINITSDKNVHRLYIAESVSDDEGFYEFVATYESTTVISTSTDIIIETNPHHEDDNDDDDGHGDIFEVDLG